MEEDVTPVLTKEVLQRWQKALLDVRNYHFLCIHEGKPTIGFLSTAPVSESPSKTIDCFPIRSAYERRGSSPFMEDRQLNR